MKVCDLDKSDHDVRLFELWACPFDPAVKVKLFEGELCLNCRAAIGASVQVAYASMIEDRKKNPVLVPRPAPPAPPTPEPPVHPEPEPHP